jgi:hypothetical protein
MFLRSFFTAAIALLLAGCSGWAAETRLIPVTERDSPGLSGAYVTAEDRFLFAPGKDGFVRAVNPAVDDPPADIAFDLLRAGEARPDRAFLVEVPVAGEEGKVVYFYEIVRVAGSSDGPAVALARYSVVCSKAAAALAARKEDKLCIFDDYTRLRAAALDALAWHDDARMAVETVTLELEDRAARIKPDGI